MQKRVAHCAHLYRGPRRNQGILLLALTACLVVTGSLAAHAAGTSRPPLPPNSREVTPGQIPRPCVAGEDITQGYYFSSTANQWVAAPYCYGKWGNLEASPSRIVKAGASVTVTAIPNEGSNSGTYAPQTGSIHWDYPGEVVSGCGAADLTCTVIPSKVGTTEWRWFEFHVSMPRTFFIDSQGSNCAGLHLCPGVTTNAWSYVGIAPGASGSVTRRPTPGSGSSGPSTGLVLGIAAALAAMAALFVANANGGRLTQSIEDIQSEYTNAPGGGNSKPGGGKGGGKTGDPGGGKAGGGKSGGGPGQSKGGGSGRLGPTLPNQGSGRPGKASGQ